MDDKTGTYLGLDRDENPDPPAEEVLNNEVKDTKRNSDWEKSNLVAPVSQAVNEDGLRPRVHELSNECRHSQLMLVPKAGAAQILTNVLEQSQSPIISHHCGRRPPIA